MVFFFFFCLASNQREVHRLDRVPHSGLDWLPDGARQPPGRCMYYRYSVILSLKYHSYMCTFAYSLRRVPACAERSLPKWPHLLFPELLWLILWRYRLFTCATVSKWKFCFTSFGGSVRISFHCPAHFSLHPILVNINKVLRNNWS